MKMVLDGESPLPNVIVVDENNKNAANNIEKNIDSNSSNDEEKNKGIGGIFKTTHEHATRYRRKTSLMLRAYSIRRKSITSEASSSTITSGDNNSIENGANNNNSRNYCFPASIFNRNNNNNGDSRILSILKNIYSITLLLCSIAVTMGLIITKQTIVSSVSGPYYASALLWCALLSLTMVEGSQASLVGLVSVDNELYKESHPVAYMCTSITSNNNRSNNLDRFLLGRQFMVVVLIFYINLSGAPILTMNDVSVDVSSSSLLELWGLPEVVLQFYLSTGLATILLTCMVGQLSTQVTASRYMLDYTNNYFALLTVWIAMCIEFSGVLHCCYALQLAVLGRASSTRQKMTKTTTVFQDDDSGDSDNDGEGGALCSTIFFWMRVLFSIALLLFCLVVTLAAIIERKTTMWDGVPVAVSMLLLVVLLSIVGLLEGMQIAFFAVSKKMDSERILNNDHNNSKTAKQYAQWTCDLLYNQKNNNGRNLPAFMIGRQLCVVLCFFILSRILTTSTTSSTVLNIPTFIQSNFVDTGLCGALLTTIIGSVIWQLIAGTFPYVFLSNPLTYYMLRLCLIIENTGICNGVWMLSDLHKRIYNYQIDETYIGTAEQRAFSAATRKY